MDDPNIQAPDNGVTPLEPGTLPYQMALGQQAAGPEGSEAAGPAVPPPQAPNTMEQAESQGSTQAPQMPARPPGTSSLGQYQGSKSQIFRSILGDFLYSAGKGLAASGHGPEANARGAGEAIGALPERDIMRQQLANQAAQIQATAALKEAQANAANVRNQPATWIDENGTPHPMSAQDFAQLKAKDLASQRRLAGTEATVEGKKETTQATLESKETTTANALASKEKLQQEAEKSNADLLGQKIKSAEKIAQWKISSAKDVAQLRTLAIQAGREAKQDEPTAQAKNSAETASVVQAGIARVRPMIDQLDQAGALGAVKGKVNDLIEGKKGFDGLGLNPQQSRLMENFIDSLKFINSGMLKTHFGARGGQQLYEKFTQMLNAGQGVDVMKGGLDAFDFYAGEYAKRGARQTPTAPKPGAVQGGEYDFVNGQLVPRKPK